MNNLDIRLHDLVMRHALNLGSNERAAQQMAKEISICAIQGYNTRAELITLVKKAIASS